MPGNIEAKNVTEYRKVNGALVEVHPKTSADQVLYGSGTVEASLNTALQGVQASFYHVVEPEPGEVIDLVDSFAVQGPDTVFASVSVSQDSSELRHGGTFSGECTIVQAGEGTVRMQALGDGGSSRSDYAYDAYGSMWANIRFHEASDGIQCALLDSHVDKENGVWTLGGKYPDDCASDARPVDFVFYVSVDIPVTVSEGDGYVDVSFAHEAGESLGTIALYSPEAYDYYIGHGGVSYPSLVLTSTQTGGAVTTQSVDLTGFSDIVDVKIDDAVRQHLQASSQYPVEAEALSSLQNGGIYTYLYD